jgi:two-component system phosphate regulon sensor histidine kinase PhoR
VRRLLLVNALIFAVLAASVALAYFGFSYTSDSRDRELRLLHDLAKEKVLNIESLIAEQDAKFLRGVQIDPMSDLRQLSTATGAAVASVFVLDDHLEIIPGGYAAGRLHDNETNAFRDWFMAHVLKELALKQAPPDERRHLYAYWGERPYLFTFMHRVANGRTFYVVIEDDLTYFVFTLFPQFFPPATASPRLYEVVDDRRTIRYGQPFLDIDKRAVEEPFTDTLDGWVLRITDRDPRVDENRRTLLNTIVIALAVAVIAASLGILAMAMWRERRANELKSEFITNVSHELKTPLSIISMFGEMLALGRTKSPEQSVEYAEIIWRESVRLGRLIDNVLDFSKIERGGGGYEFAETDVGEVVDRAIELSQRRLAAAEMTLDAEVEPELPPAMLDANAFTLAVLNLIDNAIKYAADGKKVELRVKRDGERIALSVRDWGPGIDRDEQPRVFERFYRARSVRLKPIRGSGIGLALVQHIARAHKGDVQLASEPGKGSTFTIWLPAVKVDRG